MCITPTIGVRSGINTATHPIGAVIQVGQSTTKKVVRFIGRLDQFVTHTLEVRDAEGAVLLRLIRPAEVIKSRIEVERCDGETIGEIERDNVFGAITFSLSADVPMGAIGPSTCWPGTSW